MSEQSLMDIGYLEPHRAELPGIQRLGDGNMSALSGSLSRRGMAFAGLLLAVWSCSPLRASTAYAYSSNNVNVSFSNGTVLDTVTSMASNTSSFSGFGTSTQPGPLDPPQTTVGPGPFPGENSFGPQGQIGLGYSRADTQITGSTLDALAGANVAEAYRTTPGTASDIAFDQFTFTLKATDATKPISIMLFASPDMRVTTTGDGIANASIALLVNIKNHANGAPLLKWFPNDDPLTDFTLNGGGSVSGVEDPFTLVKDLDCSGTCDKSYSTPGLNEWTLSYLGVPGQQFDVSVGWEETANATIPEPASLGLTGGALILLGVALKRSRRAPKRLPANR